jgi:predicted transcriptional regulator
MKRRSRTTDAVTILGKAIGEDQKQQALVEEEISNLRIAQLIYDARTRAGLTQRQLAKLVGTTQPVVARLEDADYRGHSLRMLQRIATALGCDLDVRFVERRE